MTSNQDRYERNKDQAERGIVRRSDAWLQAERTAHYLPVLYKQRKETAQRLMDLDELIADELRVERELRAITNGNDLKKEPQKAATIPPTSTLTHTRQERQEDVQAL